LQQGNGRNKPIVVAVLNLKQEANKNRSKDYAMNAFI